MSKPKYPYHDWSPISEKVLSDFQDELNEIALKKFGVDEDGDCPVRIRLVDRTRHEPDHWWPVPYGHDAKTDDDFREIRKAISANLQTALADMDRFLRCEDHRLQKNSEDRKKQPSAEEALRELACWMPGTWLPGKGTAESKGAKCATLNEALEMARKVLERKR